MRIDAKAIYSVASKRFRKREPASKFVKRWPALKLARGREKRERGRHKKPTHASARARRTHDSSALKTRKASSRVIAAQARTKRAELGRGKRRCDEQCIEQRAAASFFSQRFERGEDARGRCALGDHAVEAEIDPHRPLAVRVDAKL